MQHSKQGTELMIFTGPLMNHRLIRIPTNTITQLHLSIQIKSLKVNILDDNIMAQTHNITKDEPHQYPSQPPKWQQHLSTSQYPGSLPVIHKKQESNSNLLQKQTNFKKYLIQTSYYENLIPQSQILINACTLKFNQKRHACTQMSIKLRIHNQE